MTDIDRRRVLALGGTAALAALAGCSLFDDSTLPGRDGETADGGQGGGAESALGPAE